MEIVYVVPQECASILSDEDVESLGLGHSHIFADSHPEDVVLASSIFYVG